MMTYKNADISVRLFKGLMFFMNCFTLDMKFLLCGGLAVYFGIFVVYWWGFLRILSVVFRARW